MITFSHLSEIGEREINEDSIGGVHIGPGIHLFILADGLGGHGRGEEASGLIARESAQIFRKSYREEDCLEQCFQKSQDALMRKQIEENALLDLKSTLVLLKIVGGRLQWGHVGDSRLYYFEEKRLVKRTLDHSVPQMLVAAGEIKEQDIRNHPDRNRLIRVMGMEWESPKYQLSSEMPLRRNQAFLMCSDGFWENIEETQMEACLRKANDVNDWLARMEKIVLKNGKGTNMDNYSAITVMVQ